MVRCRPTSSGDSCVRGSRSPAPSRWAAADRTRAAPREVGENGSPGLNKLGGREPPRAEELGGQLGQIGDGAAGTVRSGPRAGGGVHGQRFKDDLPSWAGRTASQTDARTGPGSSKPSVGVDPSPPRSSASSRSESAARPGSMGQQVPHRGARWPGRLLQGQPARRTASRVTRAVRSLVTEAHLVRHGPAPTAARTPSGVDDHRRARAPGQLAQLLSENPFQVGHAVIASARHSPAVLQRHPQSCCRRPGAGSASGSSSPRASSSAARTSSVVIAGTWSLTQPTVAGS